MSTKIGEIQNGIVQNIEIATQDEIIAKKQEHIRKFGETNPECYKDLLDALRNGKLDKAQKLLKGYIKDADPEIGVADIFADHIPFDIHKDTNSIAGL